MMAHTLDAVIYDPVTGLVRMIVIPDDDAQLADPAFNPKGCKQVRVAKSPDPVSAAIKADSAIKPLDPPPPPTDSKPPGNVSAASPDVQP